MGPAEADWPELTVVRELGAEPEPEAPGLVVVTEDGYRVWLTNGGTIDVDHTSLTVRFRTTRPLSDDAVLHPFLALPAAFVAHWLGRHALHAGAFVHEGGVWALLGDKQGGKSSTLGCLLRRGYDVLTDDILILDGLETFPGPRAVDLRSEAAEVMGGEALGVVGARPRWRLEPGPAPSRVSLRGFVHLEWGDALTVERLDSASTLRALVASCVLRPGPEDAATLLELMRLPALRLTRPQRVEALDACVDQMLATLPAG